MTKKQAIKQAQEEVSELYKFGDGWKFNWYDEDMGCWREYPLSRNHYEISVLRGEKMLEKALLLLGSENIYSICQCYLTHGGRWTSYL